MDGNGCFIEKTVSIIIQISRRMWVKLFHMPRQCHIITTVSHTFSSLSTFEVSTRLSLAIFLSGWRSARNSSSLVSNSLDSDAKSALLAPPVKPPPAGTGSCIRHKVRLWVTIIGSMRCMFMQSVSHICKDLIIVTTIITLYRRETIKIALGDRIRKYFSQPSVENHRLRYTLFINIYGLDPWPLVVMFGLILFLFLCAIIILIVRNSFICKEMDHQ